MANVRLSYQDRKELDKFTKFLSLKTVQVVVQSRLGEKLKTKSKPFSSGVDWFSVTIDDVPEVLQETRKALSGRLPTFNLSLCIEISLKTVEGDTMVLETWSLGMTDQVDPDVRISYTVYNRMGILLKSLIAVTRVTPAYRLSCRQGPESYVICYRIYLGEPQLHALGDGYQKVRVGQVGTPLGTFCLAVSYRTKLTITPQRVERDCPFMVKSDHFKPDMSPNRPPKLWPHAESRSTCVDELAAACLECQELGCMPFPMHSPPECNGFHHQHCSPQVEKSPREPELKLAGGGDFMSLSEPKKVGAFAGESTKTDVNAVSEYLIPDTGFASLLQHDHVNNIIGLKSSSSTTKTPHSSNNNHSTLNGADCNGDTIDAHSENGSHESQKSSSSIASAAMDDFVMVELKTPFASPDPNSDLSAFYRECQAAPLLDSFKNHPTIAEQVNDITGQLAMFELNMHEFDELVDSLCSSDTWK